MTHKSANEEPWWDEFVAAYGATPLRELARRFATNPRRLRRAAQRAGLADEPMAIRKSTTLLGTIPDASLADKLKVTVDQVAGARKRRGIAAFQKFGPPKKAAPAAPESAPSEPAVRTAPSAPSAPVVVSRAPIPRSDRSGDLPGGRGLTRRLKKIDTTTPEVVVTRRTSRRRVVSADRMEEVRDKKEERLPPTPAPARRRPKAPKPAPVRIIFEKPATPIAPQHATAAEPVAPPEPAPVEVPIEVPIEVPVDAPVEVPVEIAPEAPALYWQATLDDGRTLVILAPDLTSAAKMAQKRGPVTQIGPAQLLTPTG